VRVNCVVPDWIGTDRAHREDRGAAGRRGALVDPDDLADAVVELIRDESLAGRVMVLLRGEPRRLLDGV
jgi:NAD(P)-dependent dehydrogenase (short-subunit alcohol dehydrogenase family)